MTKDLISPVFLISQPAASCACFMEEVRPAQVSLLTKLLILVLCAENNKALNPGRAAAEPYVACSLSSKSRFSSFSPKGAYIWGAPASCHISEAAVLLWMEITEWWWAGEDLN